ncbi:TonB-dependent receptor plug domain-containing protein [Tahibacter harae]|uniref:TonB-dependent receptor n=1 Tax=Tahibacter harae TaxID=2963937 RepID=A0ABT1QNK8_9GAMM|nr:TonB-dependent receptor [Tahibacter harae]MCQ4164062.1 TonB-dependent receptor [Tahibacter harae]
MRQNRNELLRAVRYALYVGTAAAVGLTAAPAFAQDEGADKGDTLETIVVTGSRIRRVDLENASPVFTIDKTSIEKTGAVTVGDLIQRTPAIAGAATNPQVNNGGGDGFSTVSLRGLGSDRTLLLVNGHRVNVNDVNQIPANAIERIEVLKDGASSVYGSDAIAGVVNFILRRDFQGLEISTSYGITDYDDGARSDFQMTFGHNSDRGSLMVGLNYNKQDAISAADRDFSNIALTLYSGEVIVGGSSRTATGRYVVPRSVAEANGINCAGSGAEVALTLRDGGTGRNISDFRCFSNATDLYNYQKVGNVLVTPQERAGMFAVGSYRISDNVEAYIEAFYNKTQSSSILAPLPFDGRPSVDNVLLSGDSYYNPFGVDIVDGRLRLERIGNRQTGFTRNDQLLTVGLRGSFGDSWQWDLSGLYAASNNYSKRTGYLYTPALTDALGPSFLDPVTNTVRCGTPDAPIAGCVPVDFFGPFLGSPAQIAALNTISPTVRNHSNSSTKMVTGNISGELFELPAGALSLAAGAEYREEYFGFFPEFLATTIPGTTNCYISNEACTGPVSGSYDVTDIYGELFVPILRDVPFAKALNLTVGARYSDYSNVGDTTNAKYGLEWRPIDDLLVRGTYAEVFRAPTITDLYSPQSANAIGFTDPCNGYTGGAADPRACANVTPDGTFRQTDTQLSGYNGGNPNLKPENGSVFTYGVIYDPSWLEGFSTSVDIWRYVLHDTIGVIGAQTILDQCYNYGRYCNLFSRNPNGEIARLDDLTNNVGRVDTKGVDIGIKYRLPETSIGTFRFSLDTTYVAQYDNEQVEGDGSTRLREAGRFNPSNKGGDGNYARWRGLGNVSWNWGAWDANWNVNYVHSIKLWYADFTDVPSPTSQGTVLRRGAYTYHDVSVGYQIEPINTHISIGIDNINDKQPPLLYQNNTLNANTDERTYRTMGRFYWARLGIKF